MTLLEYMSSNNLNKEDVAYVINFFYWDKEGK